MKWNGWFLCLLFLGFLPVWAEEEYDDFGEMEYTPEQEMFLTALDLVKNAAPEDREELYKKMETALVPLLKESWPRTYFFMVLNLVRDVGESEENRPLLRRCLEGVKADYLSIDPKWRYQSVENLHWILQEYPAQIPMVKSFLLENRKELMEAYVDGLAVYLEMISEKREKELQKEVKEWDEYYHTKLPKFNYLAKAPEGPEGYKEGWPEGGVGLSGRYVITWPYRVEDPAERAEYCRMLVKAKSWFPLRQMPELRRAYAEMEPEIFNCFAFFYESGAQNMKELRQMLNEKKVPKNMQEKIFEEMKKPYSANLWFRLSCERRRQRMMEENEN
ncbi:MAG: hypothetical protein Q4D38_05310 [Planctomycetia bacterium]|nr:hypothetical protein [Planctomycetia bacterium]